MVLYETLGPTLPYDEAPAAALWGAAQMCVATYPESVRGAAGFRGDPVAMGNALFSAVLAEKRGLIFTVDDDAVNWEWIAHGRFSGRLDLTIPELLDELAGLSAEDELTDPEFPLILSAGE